MILKLDNILVHHIRFLCTFFAFRVIAFVETQILQCSKLLTIFQQILPPLWESSTTVQCAVPTINFFNETHVPRGLGTIHIIRAGKPPKIEQSVELLIFDSSCQICDDANNCVFKVWY